MITTQKKEKRRASKEELQAYKEKRQSHIDKRKFLTLEEAEMSYGIPITTLRKWIKRDGSDGIPKLDAFKPGKEILINKETLELYIKKFPISA